jgi:histidinol-phosphate aminotransferase
MNDSDKSRFVRPAIANMEAYKPIEPFEVLSARLGRDQGLITKLDANENPYGPPPEVKKALSEADNFHIYPDPESRQLRQALSSFVNVPVERLMAGSGADELIDLVLRAVLSPGDGVIDCPPSFGMYPFSTAVNAGCYIPVPRRSDFSLDVPAIRAALTSNANAKLLFLCSPNNPDGSVIADQEILELLALPLLVVLDEAYVEFASAGGNQSRIGWVARRENLVVLRTFSKLAGLAGLRIGYGAFPEWLLPHLWKIKQPYNVNVAASLAAVAALGNPLWLHEVKGAIIRERQRLHQLLATFPFLHPLPSHANFLLARVIDQSAYSLKMALEQEGILVRYFDKPGVNDCLRITVGRSEDSDRLVAALGRMAEMVS